MAPDVPAGKIKEDAVAPHPIIMHVLWDDRHRELQAAATWQRDNPASEAPDVDASPARRHHRVSRAVALLALALGLSQDKATGTRA